MSEAWITGEVPNYYADFFFARFGDVQVVDQIIEWAVENDKIYRSELEGENFF